MKARLVELPNAVSSPPHCCIVTGRTGAVVDFGDPTPQAQGPNDPRVYVRAGAVEKAARDLLGMVSQAEHDELRVRLEEAEAQIASLSEQAVPARALREAAEIVLDALPAEEGEPAAGQDTDQPKE